MRTSDEKISILSAMFFKILAHIDVIEKHTNSLKEKTTEIMDVAEPETFELVPVHVQAMNFIINDIIEQI